MILKKIIVIILTLTMILCMTGCGKEEQQPTYFAPHADWCQEYIVAAHLDENKLNYFRNKFMNGEDAHYVFWGYLLDECELNVERTTDLPIQFAEGKMIAPDEYVLVTQDLLVGYSPIAVHFNWVNEELQMIEIVTVGTNDAAIEDVKE